LKFAAVGDLFERTSGVFFCKVPGNHPQAKFFVLKTGAEIGNQDLEQILLVSYR